MAVAGPGAGVFRGADDDHRYSTETEGWPHPETGGTPWPVEDLHVRSRRSAMVMRILPRAVVSQPDLPTFSIKDDGELDSTD